MSFRHTLVNDRRARITHFTFRRNRRERRSPRQSTPILFINGAVQPQSRYSFGQPRIQLRRIRLESEPELDASFELFQIFVRHALATTESSRWSFTFLPEPSLFPIGVRRPRVLLYQRSWRRLRQRCVAFRHFEAARFFCFVFWGRYSLLFGVFNNTYAKPRAEHFFLYILTFSILPYLTMCINGKLLYYQNIKSTPNFILYFHISLKTFSLVVVLVKIIIYYGYQPRKFEVETLLFWPNSEDIYFSN